MGGGFLRVFRPDLPLPLPQCIMGLTHDLHQLPHVLMYWGLGSWNMVCQVIQNLCLPAEHQEVWGRLRT